MALSLQIGSDTVDLAPSPIVPDWVIAGNPVATAKMIARGDDGFSYTMVWQCSPGKFSWRYTDEETVHFLAGVVTLEIDGSAPRRLAAGDIVVFPPGAHVIWTVEETVRKVAFFRICNPAPIQLAAKIYFKARAALRLAKSMFVSAPSNPWSSVKA